MSRYNRPSLPLYFFAPIKEGVAGATLVAAKVSEIGLAVVAWKRLGERGTARKHQNRMLWFREDRETMVGGWVRIRGRHGLGWAEFIRV